MPELIDAKAYRNRFFGEFILNTEEASRASGFLPEGGPVLHIENDTLFNTFLELAETLPDLVKAKLVCNRLDQMDLPFFTKDNYGEDALIRAYAVATTLVHAYIRELGEKSENEETAVELPERISLWIQKMAHQIGRLPTQTYETYILQNYKLKNKSGGYTLENIQPLTSYTGTIGEEWFIKMHVYAEAHLSKTIDFSKEIGRLMKTDDMTESQKQTDLETYLTKIARTMQSFNLGYFPKMKLFLSEEEFNVITRKYLGNWKGGVIFQADKAFQRDVIVWRGASGAGSSLLPALDASLQTGIKASDFINYMPPAHQSLIETLRQSTQGIANYIKETHNIALISAYNNAISSVSDFRRKHREVFVKPYILTPLTENYANQLATRVEKGLDLKKESLPKDFNMLISEILMKFLCEYKTLLIQYKMENLPREDKKNLLKEVMHTLKEIIFVTTEENSPLFLKKNQFKKVLSESFKIIFLELIEKHELSKKENSFSMRILDEISSAFYNLSNETIGTGEEDFSIFLTKNINECDERLLDSTTCRKPVELPKNNTLFASASSVIRKNPITSATLAAGIFAAGFYAFRRGGAPFCGLSKEKATHSISIKKA